MCHSTNEYAESLIEDNNFFDGTTIVTLNQTKGKGQRGNKWESEPGKNLTFSTILKPTFLSLNNQFYLNIVASLSVLKVFLKHGQGFKVKWPNDIYYYEKKIGGILIENKLKGHLIETTVVGIGLNINQDNFEALNATSLVKVLKKEIDLEILLRDVLLSFEYHYFQLKRGEFDQLKCEYLDNLYWKNEVHTFKSKDNFFMGEVVGIDPIGRLLLWVNGHIQSFDLKEIQFIK